MATVIEKKKFCDLNLTELKLELKNRKLETTGNELVLKSRLKQVLEKDGHDIEIYNFEIKTNTTQKDMCDMDAAECDHILEDTELFDELSEMLESENLIIKDDLNSTENHDAPKDNIKNDKNSEDQQKDKNKDEKDTIDDKDTNAKNTELVKNVEKETEDKKIDNDKSKIDKSKIENINSPKKEVSSSTKEDKDKTTADKSSANVAPKMSKKNLWVSNLSSITRATDLRQWFSKYGRVIGVKIVTNSTFPGGKCYGFVIMGSESSAAKCIERLSFIELHGRIITVSFAKSNMGGVLSTDSFKRDEKLKDEKADKNDNGTTENKKLEKKRDEKIEKEANIAKIKNDESTVPGAGKICDNEDKKPHDNKAALSSKDKRMTRSPPSHLPVRKRTSKDRERDIHVKSLDAIRAERDSFRLKEREQKLRLEERLRRERSRKAREEENRLAIEREKLAIERDRLEREKIELLKLERERQRFEREKLEMERMEIKRQQLKIEKAKLNLKRPSYEDYDEIERESHLERYRREVERDFDEPPESLQRQYHHIGHRSSVQYERIANKREVFTSDARRDEFSRGDPFKRLGPRETDVPFGGNDQFDNRNMSLNRRNLSSNSRYPDEVHKNQIPPTYRPRRHNDDHIDEFNQFSQNDDGRFNVKNISYMNNSGGPNANLPNFPSIFNFLETPKPIMNNYQENLNSGNNWQHQSNSGKFFNPTQNQQHEVMRNMARSSSGNWRPMHSNQERFDKPYDKINSFAGGRSSILGRLGGGAGHYSNY